MSKTLRLKVFQAQFGFYDSVVAAPSQAAALRAWGTHQNLFADGEAQVTTDEAAVEAAMAHPETPLRRAVGSNDGFALEPTGFPRSRTRRSARRPRSAPAKAGNQRRSSRRPTDPSSTRPKPPYARSTKIASARRRISGCGKTSSRPRSRPRRTPMSRRARRAARRRWWTRAQPIARPAARTELSPPCGPWPSARRAWRRLGGRFRCALVFAGQAGAQGGHQVDDIGVVRLGDLGRLVALLLVLDQRLQRLLVAVDELAGIERAFLLLDDLLGDGDHRRRPAWRR